MSEKHEPFLDVSSVEASRVTLRRLIGIQAGVVVAQLGLAVFTVMPETVQTAIALEEELVPGWWLILGGLVALSALVLYVWGVFELWHFRSAGIGKYLWFTFVPLFLVQSTPSVSTGLMDYGYTLVNVLAGMVVFVCFTNPAMFRAADGTMAPDSATQGSSINTASA